MIIDKKKRGSAKEQLTEYLRAAIRENKFHIGEKLPITKEFVKQAGVSSNTVRLAMAELIREGILKAIPGSGTFVVDPKERAKETAVKRIGILPIFHRLETPLPEDRYRVESVRGFLEECERRGAVAMALPTGLMDMEPEKAEAVLKIANCQGIVWLYPEPNEWRLIEYFRSINFPVVVTQRSTIDESAAFVGADYEKAGVNLGKYFIDNGCEKVLVFNYFEQTASHDFRKYCGWPVGVKQGLDRAYEMFSNDAEGKVQQLYLKGMGQDQCRRIFARLEEQEIPAVVFTNSTHFHNIFLLDSEKACSLLKGRKICVVGNRSLLDHIAPYIKDKGLDIKVLLDPFTDIAKCAVQKLVALIDGDLAGTTTLVNVELRDFRDL